MNISNDNPSVDPIEYITKQLPKDLVQLLQVRDELAKRQGSLNAVEDAVADRAKAKAEMEAAQAEGRIVFEHERLPAINRVTRSSSRDDSCGTRTITVDKFQLRECWVRTIRRWEGELQIAAAERRG